MQKVISGKRYNTKAATKVTGNENVTLYRKTTGEYFAVEDDAIQRLSLEQAKEIGEKLLDKKMFDYEFSISQEDVISFKLNLPIPIRDKVQSLADEQGISITEAINRALFNQLY